MNNVVLGGRITSDLELKGENVKYVNFNLAVPRHKKDEVDFIPIVAFDKLAESLVKNQSKGNRLYIQGYIRQENYSLEDGTRRSSLKVIASRVEFIDFRDVEAKEDLKVNTSIDLNNDINDDDIPF